MKPPAYIQISHVVTTALLQRFVSNIESLNVPVPKGLSDPLAALANVAAVIGASQDDTAHGRLVKAMKTGDLANNGARDVIAQIAVDHAAAQGLAQIAADLPAIAVRQFVENLAGDAGDELIASLRPAFDKAAADLLAARAAGIVEDTDAAAVVERDDPELLGHWQHRKAAASVIAEIVEKITRPIADPADFGLFNSAPATADALFERKGIMITDPAAGLEVARRNGRAILDGAAGPLRWTRLQDFRLNTWRETWAIFPDPEPAPQISRAQQQAAIRAANERHGIYITEEDDSYREVNGEQIAQAEAEAAAQTRAAKTTSKASK